MNTAQKLEHTPGPWKVLDAAVYTLDSSVRICDPFDAMCFSGSKEKLFSIDEREANAHLIAAAPDLLMALRSIEYLTSGKPSAFKENISVLARRAIARAEGRA